MASTTFRIDPAFVAFGRMALAGLAGGATLLLARAPLPARRDLPALLVVAAGVVFGFPLFSTLAMREVDASHGTKGNRLYYLAVSPEYFSVIVDQLGQAGVTGQPGVAPGGEQGAPGRGPRDGRHERRPYRRRRRGGVAAPRDGSADLA